MEKLTFYHFSDRLQSFLTVLQIVTKMVFVEYNRSTDIWKKNSSTWKSIVRLVCENWNCNHRNSSERGLEDGIESGVSHEANNSLIVWILTNNRKFSKLILALETLLRKNYSRVSFSFSIISIVKKFLLHVNLKFLKAY